VRKTGGGDEAFSRLVKAVLAEIHRPGIQVVFSIEYEHN